METIEAVCFSNRPQMASAAIDSVAPFPVRWLNTEGMDKSTAGLANAAIRSCQSENIIVMRDKIRATHEHLEQIEQMLLEGWAFVMLFAIGLFGIKRELVRRIGSFDIRFDNGADDYDMVFRCIENGIGVFDRQIDGRFYADQPPTTFDMKKQWEDLRQKWDYSDLSPCPRYDLGYACGWRPVPGPKIIKRIDRDRLDARSDPMIDRHPFVPWSRVDYLESFGDIMAGFRGGSELYDWQKISVIS